LIYKVISVSAWQEWQAQHKIDTSYMWLGEGIDLQDGYIHCSTPEQLATTLALYFAQRSDILLLAFNDAFNENDERLDVRWELSRNQSLFPHIYGAVQMHHVDTTYTLTLDKYGQHILPI
jgi:uncharacterized protein (DUF952 family)